MEMVRCLIACWWFAPGRRRGRWVRLGAGCWRQKHGDPQPLQMNRTFGLRRGPSSSSSPSPTPSNSVLPVPLDFAFALVWHRFWILPVAGWPVDRRKGPISEVILWGPTQTVAALLPLALDAFPTPESGLQILRTAIFFLTGMHDQPMIRVVLDEFVDRQPTMHFPPNYPGVVG